MGPGDDREVSLSLLLCPCFKKVASGDFLGDPVANTPCSQCRGPRFDP